MLGGYNQFCPIAKASEILATRWTPLILRELMADIHSFNDIHRGVPLISRAVLVTRLRELEDHGLLWGFRKRAILDALPDHRVIVRFEFSQVPRSRLKFRMLWLILERSGADVCAKDPGFEVDLIFRGKISDFVKVYLGHARWRDLQGTALTIEGDRALARQLPAWIRLDKVVGRDFPVVRSASKL